MAAASIAFMSPRAKGSVTEEHKAAMAQGRAESRAVSTYLEALEANRPRRGRKRTPESIDKQLAEIDSKMASANAVTRLELVQRRIDLVRERESMSETVDLTALEDAFVGAAKSYGERKGISYAAWKEIGVPAEVLKRAGITR